MKISRATVVVASFLAVDLSTSSIVKHSHVPVSLARRNGPAPVSAQELCTTDKCKDWAKYILESLAPNYTTIDPCTDFDKYSCDGWRNVHIYRADQSSLSVTTNMSDVNQAILRSILEGEYTESPELTGADKALDLANFKKMKTAYTTCKNEDAIKAHGITPVKKMLDDFQAIFPVVGPAVGDSSSKAELTKTMVWLYKKNVDVVVGTSTGVSSQKSTINIIL
jgi:endothelin-converting enzyme